MFGRLGHPALVRGYHEHHRGHRAHTGQHVRYESFVPWHVDKRELIAGRKRRPRVAEVNGHAAAPLHFPAVRLHPGERAHQHRLAVVHMTGGGDDVHRSHNERSAMASGDDGERGSGHGASPHRPPCAARRAPPGGPKRGAPARDHSGPQPARLDFVPGLSTGQQPSRSGPKREPASVPRIVWHIRQACVRNTSRPRTASALDGSEAGFSCCCCHA